MLRDTNDVSLDRVGGGAAVERFQGALQDIIDNIIDPNTEATKERSITIKLTFKPDENREFSSAKIHVEKKLAPITPVTTQIFIGRDKDGHGVASEFHPPKQAVIPGAEATNIYKLDKEVSGGR